MTATVACLRCRAGTCDRHCMDCGAEIVRGPNGYTPVCCDACFERTAEERMRGR